VFAGDVFADDVFGGAVFAAAVFGDDVSVGQLVRERLIIPMIRLESRNFVLSDTLCLSWGCIEPKLASVARLRL
jgi:hypothetical protein